tara:strand:+ start:20543 stop:20770 length:228 start_codon:yes stop_codon:yes gene_type:complete
MQKTWLVLGLILLTGCIEETPYNCEFNEDCVSTCGMRCVNKDFAVDYKDTCVNIRAFDCSCEKKQCYSDGEAPKN